MENWLFASEKNITPKETLNELQKITNGFSQKVGKIYKVKDIIKLKENVIPVCKPQKKIPFAALESI